MSTTVNSTAREVEELEDQLDGALARLAAVQSVLEETVPFTLVTRLHEGEAPVRVWREYREMTVADLASASGVLATVIDAVETGAVEPVLSVAARLARALGIDVSSLVPWSQD